MLAAKKKNKERIAGARKGGFDRSKLNNAFLNNA